MTVFDLVQPVTLVSMLDSGKFFWGFVAYIFIGQIFLPGYEAKGFPIPQTGRQITYSLAGFQLFIVTNLFVTAGLGFHSMSLIPVIKYFWSLFVWANIFSVLSIAYLMITRRPKVVVKKSLFHDFWFGPELNPRFLGVDLKMFFYLPSLIGLHLVILAFFDYQHNVTKHITIQMYLFQAFWWLYLFTHFINEEFMISTWDVIAENFGFMLIWGDSVYVPFWYSIGGWYIADEQKNISNVAVAGLLILHIVFHYVFRASNWQKHDFKKFGNEARIWGKEPKVLEDKLLLSGFWGICRHLNYTGEIGTYFSFALCCGTAHVVPYLLPLSLVILLVHRGHRDDNRCRQKYRTLWDKYCRVVRYKMIPYVY